MNQIRFLFSTLAGTLQRGDQLTTRFFFTLVRNFSKLSFHRMTKRRMAVTLTMSSIGLYYADVIKSTQIEVNYQNTSENQEILAACPSLSKKTYMPTLFLPTALCQLYWSNNIESDMPQNYKRELVFLKDGGQVGLDWMMNENVENIVVVCHGLTGGGDCNYVKHTLYSLWEEGFTAVCLNQRGVAGVKLTTPQYHNHADTADLKEILSILKERYPKANFYGIGLSIGGNLVLRYAGQEGQQCLFKSVVSIANPFNLQKSEVNIMKMKSIIYRRAITENFKWLLRKHLKEMESCIDTHKIDIEKAMQAQHPSEFDEYFTRRLFNYPDTEYMYKVNSCDHLIENIKVPTLCINSKNDPIAIWENAPTQVTETNPNVIFTFTQRGGHIEWYEGFHPKRVTNKC